MPLFTQEQARTFRGAKPFPHIVVDGFWPEADLVKAEAEFPAPGDSRWKTYPDLKEWGKRAMDNPSQWGLGVAQFMAMSSSPAMLEGLEQLTGLEGLTADALGGGMHMTGTDGRLDMHVDFNVHPDGQRLRRLNVLTFLARDWDPSWGGVLYLGEHRQVEIVPAWNRLVVFECSDVSWHGHPDPIVGDHWRKSLACYYYTPLDREVSAHTTAWLTT